MRRRIALASLAGGVALLLPAAASAAAGPKLHGNNLFSNCRFSHVADDDPIVHPREPGKSHPHTFFGNTSTDAYSTVASLSAAATTCKPRADRAAYWVPTLFQDGREVRPAKGQFYYVLRGYGQMHPFPLGLRMIAGDARARSPQSPLVTYWTCGGRSGVKTAPSATVPTCGVVDARFHALIRKCETCSLVPTEIHTREKTFLELHVNFPDCWDGKRLDSPDHRSHMA